MSGGIPLRSITAVAAISLLALASFGTVLVFEIPVTADEALHHAENVFDPGDGEPKPKKRFWSRK